MPASQTRPASRSVLLTGGTGLLGSYVIRDLLLDGCGLAVVVRRERRIAAATRIEAIVHHWERVLGKRLTRPTVLEGDLNAPLCGLDETAIGWVREHCDTVLHNAASLTFRGADREQEPWRSNVHGTANVLGVAKAAGLRHFHHVSTAYVCGLRTGTVCEDDLDVGQDFSNDYERSKVEAERLVRSADHLDSVTVLRPSIIVGDSRTGFTSTYHGYYVILRLGHTLIPHVPWGIITREALVQSFGVHDHDTKNLVPVDWVSAAIAHVVQTPSARGHTFHLTNPRPVPMDVITRSVEEAVKATLPDPAERTESQDGQWLAENLVDQMDVYRTYLRDDPVFDRTHIDAVAPHLPCPELDVTTLRRMADFAIARGFGREPAFPVPTDSASGAARPIAGVAAG
ncbi:MAG: SDR family oxidoreductase [Planctomycetaceae bacterium]